MANKCQLWLTTIVLTAIVLYNSVHVEAGKKKEKGLIIVLSNGGCGGNILVQTAKDGKKGGGHKIVVKGGDSGGGCGCSNSCGSCGGGGDHHHVQHVPVPVPVPPGHPIPPMGHPEMHAAMMSQLVPAFSADDPHQSSGSSDDSGDQDTQASDSATSATSSDDASKDSTDSSSDSASSSASEKAKMVAPLFIPMNAITPPWFHGSPVFMDPSSQNHLSSTIKNMPNRYSSSSPSASQSESNYQQNGEKGEFAQSSNVAPTFNDPMFNLHGPGSNFMAPPMGYQGFDENPLLSQSLPAPDSNKKDPSESNKTQGSRGGRSGYLQPLIDSVQRLLRGPSPLREIEQGLVKQGQRMQASFSNLVPIAITNYTSYLPSLPGLRSSSGNRDRKPTTNRRSRYLESLRVRLRPLTTMEGNRLTPFIGNLWKNIRGRGSTVTSPIESASTTNQVKNQELNNNLLGTGGHNVLPIDPANGHHPHHHFNIPGQQNNQVMQQYLEQILTSKWWEWPTGGLLGPNLNQY